MSEYKKNELDESPAVVAQIPTPHCAAYLDFMGFGKMVCNAEETGDYASIIDILSACKEIVVSFKEMSDTLDGLKISMFSDSLVVSLPATNAYYAELFAIHINSLLCFLFEKTGCVVRGGISYGKLYHSDQILFGKAMVDAVNYEKISNYPRVMIDIDSLNPVSKIPGIERIRDTFKELDEIRGERKYVHIYGETSEQFLRREAVAKDFDGILFLNYLSDIFETRDRKPKETWSRTLLSHKLLIEKNLLTYAQDLRVRPKYEWLKSYHNWFCAPFEQLKSFVIF